MSEQKRFNHNDEPVLENAFNQDFIARLCESIRHCDPPKGMAVTGYWGSGKTSTLKQLYYQLTGDLPPGCTAKDKPAGELLHQDKALVPVWFEAWRFQHEQQPITALLNEIRVKIGLLDKFMSKGKKIADITLLSSLNIFDEVIKMASGGTVTPKTGGIMAIGEKWEKEHYLNKLPSSQISGLLEEAIKKGLGKRIKGREKRLIIFIDDLDRCLPTASLRLLEGIKIYLNLSNCIIVFGMDHRQLEQSLLEVLPWIDSKNKEDRKQATYYANEYLEKICQDIHQLPVPDQEEKAAYFKKLLVSLNIKLISGDDAGLSDHADNLDTILHEFDCLPANPRKIKMLVNRVALILREVRPEQDDPVDRFREYKMLLVAAVISTFHKPLHEQLESNPKYIREVINYGAIPVVTSSEEKALKDFVEDQGDRDSHIPMAGMIPSMNRKGERIPVNPSDSNVFRIHKLVTDLDPITEAEMLPYLRLKS